MAGPKVVVIGAGVVGAALADELTLRGYDDVTVVDQGPLPATGGSSSHAPGLIFQANVSRTMTLLAQYTIDKLRSLDCLLPVGSLEVATTPARLAELHRRQGWLAATGGQGRVVDPDECLRLHPLLDREAVLGGLHVPGDGLARAVRAVQVQLDRAAARGARLLDRHEVLDIRTAGGRVTGVVTDRGELAADLVVCAAGIWGPRVARMAGLRLPLTPLAHQLAWTGPVPALHGRTAEATDPILRHQDADLYVRDRGDRLGIGYYGHRPLPISAEDIVPVSQAAIMPSMLPFTAEDFEPAWADVRALLPAARETKIDEGFNGLFSFTTDNLPLLGESPDVAGFWVAEAVWVTHSAGVGRAVAEWIVDGVSRFDLSGCDLNRFEPHQLAPDYVLARDCQNYIEVYDIVHPLQPMEAPRPLRTTPFHPRQRELGAAFLEYAGWERPQWFEANAHLVAGRSVPAPDEWAARYWSPIVAAEAQATREAVALYDMSSLKRAEVAGAGAAGFLHWISTGDIHRPVGSVTYCLLLNADGGIRSDVTIARLGEERFQVGLNGQRDIDWLRRHAPAGVSVTDLTAGTCCIGLWGPRARDVLQPLTDADLSNDGLRYFRATQTYAGMVPVTALRLSYVGELGWELYTTADLGLKLWDTLWAAGRDHGLLAAGRGAFTSLRLEKGYRAFGTDMTHEHDPVEAGLGFAVKAAKGDFFGREGLQRRPHDRRLACLTLDGVVMGGEPVYRDGAAVGYVTSAAYGYTVGTGIAYAWLPAELAEPGQTVHIGYFDRRIPATVAAEPLFDPAMSRLKG